MALAAVMLLAGCDDAPAEDPAAQQQARCDEVVAGLVDDIQVYVDGFEQVQVVDYATGAGLPDAAGVEVAIERRQRSLSQLGCDPPSTQRALAAELGRLRSEGAIAQAVGEAMRVGVLGGRADQPREIEVGVDDDLAALAVTAPAGSTLRLAPGQHQTSEPIIVATPLRILGAGPGRTEFVSDAGESALVALEGADLVLRGLSVDHTSSDGAAALVVRAVRYLLEDLDVRGPRGTEEDIGGVGILLEQDVVGPIAPRERLQEPRGQRVVQVTVRDSGGPGVLVTGLASPTLEEVEIVDNGVCGVCLVGRSAAQLRDSVVTGNTTGVLVSDTARPQVLDSQVSDNDEDGLLFDGRAAGRIIGNEITGNALRGVTVTGDASPELEGNLLAANGEVGVAVLGAARTRLDGEIVREHAIGIFADDQAEVVLRGVLVEGAGDAGIILAGQSSGRIEASTVEGRSQGIEVRGSARVRLTDNQVTGQQEVSLLLRDEGVMEGRGNTCASPGAALLVLDEARSELDGDGCPPAQPAS